MVRPGNDSPTAFINREESWLNFNWRVLEEAEDPLNPLLERVKFLAISASNLDEFFEVRVGGLLQQLEDGYNATTPDGLTMVEERELLNRLTHEFVEEQYSCWNERLRPELARQGIRVLSIEQLNDDVLAYVDEYCERELDPLLTPVTVDPAHPFPRVINKALCVALLLRRRRRSSLTYTGVVTVPRSLPRLVRLPSQGTIDFISLADLVTYHAGRMYHGYDIVSSSAFRVTRNSNLYFEEEEARSLLETIRVELHNRRKGAAVRCAAAPSPASRPGSVACSIPCRSCFPTSASRSRWPTPWSPANSSQSPTSATASWAASSSILSCRSSSVRSAATRADRAAISPTASR